MINKGLIAANEARARKRAEREAAETTTPAEEKPATLIDLITGYKAAGLSDEDALHMAQRKLGVAPQGIDERMAAQDAKANGPDPAMVEAYNRRMSGYTPPKLDETYEVTIPVRFADWVKRFAAWESVKRGRQVGVEEAVAMMVREHWHFHSEDRAMLQGAKTGPAGKFNPVSGRYE